MSGYQDDFELVEGTHSGAIESFTVICAKNGMPRLLLPPSRRLMQTALTNFLGGRRSATWLPPVVQVAAKVGGPLSRLSFNVSLVSRDGAASPLRELISGVIGRSDFHIALRASFGRPNAKTVAMAIADSGEVLCYVKLGSEAMTSGLVAHESAVLKQFAGTDIPLIIPPVLYAGVWADGPNVLITGSMPLEPLNHDASIAHRAADALAQQNRVSATPLRDSDYWHGIVRRVGEYDNAEALVTLVADIERIWGSGEYDFGASHGDWTRANVGMVNGQAAAFDWERCSMQAPRGIDIAHFAIAEQTFRPFAKSINIEQVAAKVRQYLGSVDRSSDKAESLIVFALLEMVIRFQSAQKEGWRINDSKFRPAIQEAVRKWA